MDMLKKLFIEFDKLSLELNTYKLYTIGDCYVAFGMVDMHNRRPPEEARNIIHLAFGMVDIIA
jgi:transcription elongation factor GreA-like protein